MVEPATGATPHDPGRRPAARAATLVVTLVLAVLLVQGLREFNPVAARRVDRPRHHRPRGRDRAESPDPALPVVAEDLWSSCRSRLPAPIELVAIIPTMGHEVQLHLDRALGRTGRARLTGCLEDYTLDLVKADVLSIVTSSTPTG